MTSQLEQSRFEWTNNIIKTHLSPLDSILEVGCGEGHQSLFFSQLCRSLYGIDVSERAIRRASLKCVRGHFSVGDIFQFFVSMGNRPQKNLIW